MEITGQYLLLKKEQTSFIAALRGNITAYVKEKLYHHKMDRQSM